MIYAETEIKLKNGCTAVVRNARPEDAKQTIEYLRTVSGESPFLLREPDEVNFTVEKERAILQNKAESPNEIMLTAYVNGELAGNCSLACIIKHTFGACKAMRIHTSGTGCD